MTIHQKIISLPDENKILKFLIQINTLITTAIDTHCLPVIIAMASKLKNLADDLIKKTLETPLSAKEPADLSKQSETHILISALESASSISKSIRAYDLDLDLYLLRL